MFLYLEGESEERASFKYSFDKVNVFPDPAEDLYIIKFKLNNLKTH